MIVSATRRVKLDQLALGLRMFVDTDRLVDGLPKLGVVYAVTSSSYVEKYYVLLGTENGPVAWYAADTGYGAEKLNWKPCEGFLKLSPAPAAFVNELIKHFQSKLEQGVIARNECSIYV